MVDAAQVAAQVMTVMVTSINHKSSCWSEMFTQQLRFFFSFATLTQTNLLMLGMEAF